MFLPGCRTLPSTLMPSGGVRFGTSLSLDDFAELLGETGDETGERLGERLSGTVDADMDSVEEVRDVREQV